MEEGARLPRISAGRTFLGSAKARKQEPAQQSREAVRRPVSLEQGKRGTASGSEFRERARSDSGRASEAVIRSLDFSPSVMKWPCWNLSRGV